MKIMQLLYSIFVIILLGCIGPEDMGGSTEKIVELSSSSAMEEDEGCGNEDETILKYFKRDDDNDLCQELKCERERWVNHGLVPCILVDDEWVEKVGNSSKLEVLDHNSSIVEDDQSSSSEEAECQDGEATELFTMGGDNYCAAQQCESGIWVNYEFIPCYEKEGEWIEGKDPMVADSIEIMVWKHSSEGNNDTIIDVVRESDYVFEFGATNYREFKITASQYGFYSLHSYVRYGDRITLDLDPLPSTEDSIRGIIMVRSNEFYKDGYDGDGYYGPAFDWPFEVHYDCDEVIEDLKSDSLGRYVAPLEYNGCAIEKLFVLDEYELTYVYWWEKRGTKVTTEVLTHRFYPEENSNYLDMHFNDVIAEEIKE